MPRYRGLAPATADDESGCLYCKFTVEANIRRQRRKGHGVFRIARAFGGYLRAPRGLKPLHG